MDRRKSSPLGRRVIWKFARTRDQCGRTGKAAASSGMARAAGPAGVRENPAVAVNRHDYFSDTDPRAFEVMIESLRAKTPEERMALAFELTSRALRASEAGVRMLYPNADEHEVKMRAAARRYDRETMIRAFGWDPAEHP